MPFKRPTLQQLDERIHSDITGSMRMTVTTSRRASVLRRSVIAVNSRVYAGTCHLLYGYLDNLARQRFVHSMDDEFLDAEGGMYAIERKASDVARGNAAINGNNGATVPLDRIYQHESGAQYKVTANAPIIGGSAVITLEAVAAGVAGNLLAGEIVRPVQPVAGVNDEAIIDEPGLIGGINTEGDDDYRERILDRKREPPHGGNKHDYEVWAKEVSGVTRAWCLPLWLGMGTVGVMFVRDYDADIIPTKEQCEEVAAHIEEVRPVTADVSVFPPVRKEINVTVQIFPDDDATRRAVEAEVGDFIVRDGGPGETLRASRISEAISAAVGEHHHYLLNPVNDIPVGVNEIPVLGKVVFVESSNALA